MLHRTERTLENIPVGSLGMIPIDGCQELGDKVNDYLVKWRKESISKTKMMLFSMITRRRLISSMPRFLVLVPEKQKVLSTNQYEEKIFT